MSHLPFVFVNASIYTYPYAFSLVNADAAIQVARQWQYDDA